MTTATGPEVADEPGGMKVGDRVPESSAGHDITVSSIEEGQWFWAYSSKDGTRSRLNINMRPFMDPMNPRAWRNEDGQIAFVDKKPEFAEPVVGNNILCLLHPDNPIRPHLETIGLKGRYCTRTSGLATDFDLARHMLKSHGGENRIIQDNKTSIEMAKDREERARATDAQIKTAEAMTAVAERLVDDNRTGQPNGGRSGSNEGSDGPGDDPVRRGPGRPKQS